MRSQIFVSPQLREKIDAGSDIELTEDTNPHDVACLLKEFFRCLPEPLLTRELYYPFLSTTSEWSWGGGGGGGGNSMISNINN